MKKACLVLVSLLWMVGCGGEPPSGSTDMAMGNPNGAPFGSPCTMNADCMSNLCQSFQQMTIRRCTQPCTMATAATDCPNPPSAGTCTNNNYCRFTQ